MGLERSFHTLSKLIIRPPIRSALLLSCCLFAAACASNNTAPEATIGPRGTAEYQLAESLEPLGQTWPKLNRFQTLRFDSYSVEDGLSQSSALSLLQDSRGFLYFGSSECDDSTRSDLLRLIFVLTAMTVSISLEAGEVPSVSENGSGRRLITHSL